MSGTATTERRPSIAEWLPPSKTVEVAVEDCEAPVDAPEVGMRVYKSPDGAAGTHGVFFQKCGGGRRILRKRIGNN